MSKGPNFKHGTFTSNITKKNNDYKSMYCLQKPILAEVQVCCWKGKHALAKVTTIVQSCNASFAKMGMCEKGRIFNIIAFSIIYVKYNSMYIVTVVAYVEGFFNVSSSSINVSNRMYMFNPFYSTVTPLRMCTLVLRAVDLIHIKSQAPYLDIRFIWEYRWLKSQPRSKLPGAMHHTS